MTPSDNPYLRIGARPFINCCGVRTIHSGSLFLPEVRHAMAAAARNFVNIDELMHQVGDETGIPIEVYDRYTHMTRVVDLIKKAEESS